MNIQLQSSSSFAPYSPYIGNGKLVINEEQAARARFVTSRDFIHSQNPFEEQRYKDIRFPMRGNFIGDRQAITTTQLFRRVQEKLLNRATDKARVNIPLIRGPDSEFPVINESILRNLTIEATRDDMEEAVASLHIACNQYQALDYRIYKNRDVVWHFQADFSYIPKDQIHRPTGGNALDHHVDGGLDNPILTNVLFRDLRTQGHSQGDTGVPRFWVAANIFPTEFRDVPNALSPWEIGHFIAEPHRSPLVKENCARFFLLGRANPRLVR